MVLCANCGKREAIGPWAGSGCHICALRDGLDKLPQWCDLCMTQSQVAYMTDIASKLPGRLAHLKELEEADGQEV